MNPFPTPLSLSPGRIDLRDDRFFCEGFPYDADKLGRYRFFHCAVTKEDRYLWVGDPAVLRTFLAEHPTPSVPVLAFAENAGEVPVWRMLLESLASHRPRSAARRAELVGDMLEKTESKASLENAFPEIYARKGRLRLALWMREQATSLRRFVDREKAGFREYEFVKSRFSAVLQPLAQALSGMNLNGNRCVALLEILSDLKRLRPDEFPRLLDDVAKINRSLGNPDPNLKYKNIREFLIPLKYPRLTAMRRRKNELVRQLGLPPQIRCSFDAEGETEALEFAFSCENSADYRDRAETLQKLAGSHALEALFGD